MFHLRKRSSLHATSKTQSTEAISEKSVVRPILGYAKQKDGIHVATHLESTLDKNGGPAPRLLSVYNNDKLKFQLSDMEKEITRLKFKNDTPKYATSHVSNIGSGFARQTFQTIDGGMDIHSEALHRRNNLSDPRKFPEAKAKLNGGSAQQTIMELTSMLKRYNKHVAYLESRLSATENHVVELQSTIKQLSESKGPKVDTSIRANQKLADTSYGQDRFFRQKVDILNSWEQDLINGVLDPHINAVVEKLQKDLYSQLDVNLDSLRDEVKRIHTVVDDRLKTSKHSEKNPVTTHNYTMKPSARGGGEASSRFKSLHRKAGNNNLQGNVDAAASKQSKKKKYVELINKLREKLEEKQRTVEAIKLVQEKAKRYNKKKKQYKATVHANVHSDISDNGTKIFEVGIEEN